jgi:hypothetical protein
MPGRGSGGIIPRYETAVHNLGREAPKAGVDTLDGTARKSDVMIHDMTKIHTLPSRF